MLQLKQEDPCPLNYTGHQVQHTPTVLRKKQDITTSMTERKERKTFLHPTSSLYCVKNILKAQIQTAANLHTYSTSDCQLLFLSFDYFNTLNLVLTHQAHSYL